MAAETGSGKTGAFCLPVIQVVYETLKEIQEQKTQKPKSESSKNIQPVDFRMSAYDRTPSMGKLLSFLSIYKSHMILSLIYSI